MSLTWRTRWFFVILAGTIGLRLIFFGMVAQHPERMMFPDSANYDELAQNLLDFQTFSSGPKFMLLSFAAEARQYPHDLVPSTLRTPYRVTLASAC